MKEPLLKRYYHTVLNLISWFNKVTLEHIQREDNVRVDVLSRLATTKRKSHQRSVVQICLRKPSVGSDECLAVTEDNTWMTPIKKYLELGFCKPE